MTPALEKCFKKFKITDPALQQKILSDHNYHFNDEHCFMKCVFESDNIVTADGKLNSQMVKSIAAQQNKPLSDQQIASCNAIGQKAGKDPCMVATAGFDCIYKSIT